MPERYGKWTTISSRFQQWRKKGVSDRVLARLQTVKSEEKQVDWEIHLVDGSVVRAHQHACSAVEKEALGRSRGGLSTKIHLRVDGKGQMIIFLLTPGQQYEMSVAKDLMDQGWIKQANGKSGLRPRRVVGDKGYTSKEFRHFLHQRGIRYTILRRSNEERKGQFDKKVYRERNKVERLFQD
jgi:transposase